MVKRIARTITLFALTNIVNAYDQNLAHGNSSVEFIDETRIQYCVFNDFEGKDSQVVELGFEGLAKPKGKLFA